MALYHVFRTDATDENEYDAFVVRAKGRKQALELVTKAVADQPFQGVKADGSNVAVERIADTRDADNRVIVASYFAA
jgi:hypothetical protein